MAGTSPAMWEDVIPEKTHTVAKVWMAATRAAMTAERSSPLPPERGRSVVPVRTGRPMDWKYAILDPHFGEGIEERLRRHALSKAFTATLHYYNNGSSDLTSHLGGHLWALPIPTM